MALTTRVGISLMQTTSISCLQRFNLKIIKLCMPKRDACRMFEIHRAPYNLIYLREKRETEHTLILSVSKVFRNIYLKHLPIMPPSFNNKPIYIHQDTTVILDMTERDFRDLAECTSRRSPAFFSQIRHLAIPLLSFGSCPDCSVTRRICGERVDVIVSRGILILSCSNLQSLTAIRAQWSLKSLQSFLHLQQFIGIYSYIKPAYHLIAERNMNDDWNNAQDSLGDREHLSINKTNVERILHIEIDFFISNFPEDSQSDSLGEQYQWNYSSILNLNTYRYLLHDFYFTNATEKLFKANEKFEDNKNNRESMKLIREAYEHPEESSGDDE
ncbi:hypothetical protein EAF04_010479 [Stromatinia cepivora]|nr:hypothetical protein EAF04_010479 [Stromatinia cepivora]